MQQSHSKANTLKVSNAELMPQLIGYINQGHTVSLVLNGYSMRPFLEDGRDVGVLSKPEGVKKGDAVLAFVDGRRYVLHRIIAIDANGNVTLRGDGNRSCEYCQIGDVKAKAIGFYRKGRKTMDSTDSAKWKAYSFVWTRLYPVRRYLLFAYRVLLKLGLISNKKRN